MKTVLFYPHSIQEVAKFQGLLNSSDYYGEWNPMSLRFEFREEAELAFQLQNDLQELAGDINGHFEIE